MQKFMKGLLAMGLLFCTIVTFAQTGMITGKVTDAANTPLIGVSVMVKGTTNGNVTDVEGKYTLQQVPANAVLVFSSVGYLTQEIPAGNKGTVNVSLKEDTKSLNEVVVVGYGTAKKIDVSGSVKQVSGNVLENRPLANLGSGLQGMIPNLNITMGNGSAPGQGATFNIRGYTSLNGGSPLILVDGVVQDPNLINPNDVASVSVLQDAASAAIYGARAAYGVVLITTKSGKKDQPVTINVSTSYAVNDLTVRPKYANSLQYINYMDSASVNAGNGVYFSQRIRNGVEAYYKDPAKNPYVLYDPNIDIDGKYVYVGNTDWADILYQQGSLQQNNISFSGGSDNTSYYMSYGNSRQDGFLASYNDYYSRNNATVSS